MVIIAALTYIKTDVHKNGRGLTVINFVHVKQKIYKHGKVNRGCFVF